jgi:hypothetical protein
MLQVEKGHGSLRWASQAIRLTRSGRTLLNQVGFLPLAVIHDKLLSKTPIAAEILPQKLANKIWRDLVTGANEEHSVIIPGATYKPRRVIPTGIIERFLRNVKADIESHFAPKNRTKQVSGKSDERGKAQGNTPQSGESQSISQNRILKKPISEITVSDVTDLLRELADKVKSGGGGSYLKKLAAEIHSYASHLNPALDRIFDSECKKFDDETTPGLPDNGYRFPMDGELTPKKMELADLMYAVCRAVHPFASSRGTTEPVPTAEKLQTLINSLTCYANKKVASRSVRLRDIVIALYPGNPDAWKDKAALQKQQEAFNLVLGILRDHWEGPFDVEHFQDYVVREAVSHRIAESTGRSMEPVSGKYADVEWQIRKLHNSGLAAETLKAVCEKSPDVAKATGLDTCKARKEAHTVGKPAEPAAPPCTPPKLDEPKSRVRVDAKWYDVTDEAKRMLKILFEAKGAWIQGKNIGGRPDKIRNAMPKPVKQIVESHRRNGYRIPSLLPK